MKAVKGRSSWPARSRRQTGGSTLAVSPGVPFLLTTAQSFGQQSGRAFAAELLAPADGIRQLLGGETPWPEDIGKIATHYNVSEYIINHQIDNQILRPPWNTAV